MIRLQFCNVKSEPIGAPTVLKGFRQPDAKDA